MGCGESIFLHVPTQQPPTNTHTIPPTSTDSLAFPLCAALECSRSDLHRPSHLVLSYLNRPIVASPQQSSLICPQPRGCLYHHILLQKRRFAHGLSAIWVAFSYHLAEATTPSIEHSNSCIIRAHLHQYTSHPHLIIITGIGGLPPRNAFIAPSPSLRWAWTLVDHLCPRPRSPWTTHPASKPKWPPT